MGRNARKVAWYQEESGKFGSILDPLARKLAETNRRSLFGKNANAFSPWFSQNAALELSVIWVAAHALHITTTCRGERSLASPAFPNVGNALAAFSL